MFGEQRGIERLPHAVQALELIALGVAGVLDHACNRERIVRGKLRIKARTRAQELARAHEITEIGHGLAREHGVVGKTALLCALDLDIPIRALRSEESRVGK